MTVSVVIPTLNEATVIEKTLANVLELRKDKQVIVSDGGSTDETEAKVKQFQSVDWISSPPGRGAQLNKGASVATGECILFLHADTLLPENALNLILDTLENPEVAGGSFCLNFDQPHWVLDVCSRFSRINSSLFTYGDQGLFMRRSVFEEIGGYREWPLLEDLEIQQRLRKKGRFVKLTTPVTTSARRFLRNGPLTQILKDIILVTAFKLGASPFTIARMYGDK